MLEDYTANRESEMVMQDRAWRLLFGRPIEEENRRIISLVPVVNQCGHGANKTNMIAAIMLDTGRSEPTARKMLDRCADLKLVQSVSDDSNANRRLFRVPSDVQMKVAKIGKIMPVISAIVVKQAAAPTDYEAGKELLPQDFADIYFNARDPKETTILRDAITAIATKIKESKKCSFKRAA